MTERELPTSGYALVKIYTPAMEMRHREAGERSEHDQVSFGWDWRVTKDEFFEVRITVAVEPHPARRDHASVALVGVFRQVGDKASLSREEFVSLQAVAILLPYARQILSSLTAYSADRPFYLPTLNVAALMKDFDPAQTTAATSSRRVPKGRKRTSRS